MSTSNGRDFDVIIVGAGVIGAVMASLLLARKLSARRTGGRGRGSARQPAPAADADWDAARVRP